MLKKLILGMTCLLSLSAFAENQRPPQFVLISFDGSYSHKFWDESFYLSDMTKAKFSYFISGVYFIKKNDRMLYNPPQHKAGRSDIGFGDDDDTDLQKRTEYVWKAAHSGFDIGSHVNGHFSGATWSKEDWTSEFTQFHSFVENIFDQYPTLNADFSKDWKKTLHDEIKGFRAPLLDESLFTKQVLNDFNYTYDASLTLENRWPKKINDTLWNIGLSEIPLAGTKRKTIAMDYNLLYGQCNGKFNPKSHGDCAELTDKQMAYFEKQTYTSYINAFLKSYYGNRSPISIGHHFSLFNKGIYWKTLQRFVYDVCSQPEVQCITHKEMVQWLEQKSVENGGLTFLTSLNQGKFDKTNIPQAPKDTLKPEMDETTQVAFGNQLRIPEISLASEKVMLKGDLSDAHQSEVKDEDLKSFRYTPRMD